MKTSANALVYRRSPGERWHEVRHGLPASQGRRIAVVAASAVEPDMFYLSAEGQIYRSADKGIEWQRLTVEWADGSQPHHALAVAIIESE
jgi:hypothetical protein